MAERYADASANENAREILQILVNRGVATDGEKAELKRLEASAESDRQAIGETRAMGRGVVQGATLSLGDEIANLPEMLKGEGAYSAGLEESRAKNDAAAQAYPESYSRGQALGGAATMAAPLGALGAALKGTSTLTQMAMTGLAGGGMAALNDFNAGEGGAGSRLGNISPLNVAIGAGTGVTAPVVGKALGRAFGNYRAPVGKPLIDAGFDPKASRIASRSITDDANAIQGDLKSYLSGMGDESMIIDAGRNTMMQGRALAGMPGPGAQRLVQALDARNAGTAGRVRSAINDVGGDVQDQALLEALRKKQRTSQASPLYEAAKASPDPVDVRDTVALIDALIADAAPGSAALKRFRKMLLDNPSAARVHNIRSEIDGMARAAWAKNPAYGGTYRDVVSKLDEQLDTIPGYAKARQTWADSKALDNASDAGMRFTDNMDSDRLRVYFNGLSDPEKAAYRSAARRALDLKMGRAMNENTKAASLMGPTEMRAKIDIVFGDGSADKLLSREVTEKTFKEKRNRVTAGSDTAATLEAQKELAPMRDDAGHRLGPVQRARQAVNEPINALVDDILRKPRGKALEDLADILMASGQQRDDIVQALLNDGANIAKNQRVSQQTKRVLEALFGAAGGGIAVSGPN